MKFKKMLFKKNKSVLQDKVSDENSESFDIYYNTHRKKRRRKARLQTIKQLIPFSFGLAYSIYQFGFLNDDSTALIVEGSFIGKVWEYLKISFYLLVFAVFVTWVIIAGLLALKHIILPYIFKALNYISKALNWLVS